MEKIVYVLLITIVAFTFVTGGLDQVVADINATLEQAEKERGF